MSHVHELILAWPSPPIDGRYVQFCSCIYKYYIN